MADSKGLRFKDMVAIVTGGCKGIGRGCVDVLAENGGRVVVIDIDDEIGNKLPTLVGPGELLFVHCDTTKEEDIKNAVETTISKFGRIDLLVNNAGWHPPNQFIDDVTAADFRQLFDLNVMGYFLMCKYALPHIRTTKGSIVNISSMSHIGQRAAISYVTTKGGVSAMTRALAVDEAKNGVRVNAISPGSVMTPLMVEWLNTLDNKEEAEKEKDLSLLRRIADPKEIGLACLFLAADATFSTGIDLSCTGGNEIGLGNKHY